MNDTSPKMTAYYDRMIMERSPQERLRMGCSMFDTAKQIVHSAIISSVFTKQNRQEVFLRFYGHDFNEQEKNKILESLTD